jgi:putative GTP pyrophosphokinase
MAGKLSKSQIDQLGERIRGGMPSALDMKDLDSYRLSFASAYAHVVGRIRSELDFELTGRPTKSTTSISDKLARESTRLSQIQDIAGCRVVVPDVMVQDLVVTRLTGIFGRGAIFDRRQKPSSGYRAVHVVVRSLERPIEIQVRTVLQHMWAELSEKLSDVVSPTVKYGGGPRNLTDFLGRLSQAGAAIEFHEKRIGESGVPDEKRVEIAAIKKDLDALLRAIIRDVSRQRDD